MKSLFYLTRAKAWLPTIPSWIRIRPALLPAREIHIIKSRAAVRRLTRTEESIQLRPPRVGIDPQRGGEGAPPPPWHDYEGTSPPRIVNGCACY